MVPHSSAMTVQQAVQSATAQPSTEAKAITQSVPHTARPNLMQAAAVRAVQIATVLARVAGSIALIKTAIKVTSADN